MPAALSLEGARFGRLVADHRVGKSGRSGVPWRCVCDCGARVTVRAMFLRRGTTRSCGCLRRDNARNLGFAKRGEAVSYAAAHQRICRERGRAAEHMCPCGVPAQQWAYSNADPDEQTEKRPGKGSTSLLAYSLDPQHYVAMCVPCHAQLDAAHRAEVMA